MDLGISLGASPPARAPAFILGGSGCRAPESFTAETPVFGQLAEDFRPVKSCCWFAAASCRLVLTHGSSLHRTSLPVHSCEPYKWTSTRPPACPGLSWPGKYCCCRLKESPEASLRPLCFKSNREGVCGGPGQNELGRQIDRIGCPWRRKWRCSGAKVWMSVNVGSMLHSGTFLKLALFSDQGARGTRQEVWFESQPLSF